MSYITLSQLQNKIKISIERNITAQWVLCDISDMKLNGAGHCYLELVEKNESKGAIPKAKVTAIIWKSNFAMINSFFINKTGIKLGAGLKVMLLVEVTYHELYGLSLVVRDIDPSYSLGDIERIRRETIAQLTADGIIDMNKEHTLPIVIDRVAIISSPQAAGYGDFINHLTNNDYGYTFTTKLFEAVVQGDGAENSIISALLDIANDIDDYDAVIIIRGGGSQSDLSCFNNYTLCSYIAQFPLPILTGIGHDRDQSVADLVSHTSLKTPTAVANFLVDTKREFENLLDSYLSAITTYLKIQLNDYREEVERLSTDLRISTIERTAKEKIKLERALSTIEIRSKGLIAEKKKELIYNSTDINNISKNIILDSKNILLSLFDNIKSKSNSLLVEENHNLELLNSKISSYDTKHILKLGYSIAMVNGKAIKSIKDAKKGDNIKIKVEDGEISSTVN